MAKSVRVVLSSLILLGMAGMVLPAGQVGAADAPGPAKPAAKEPPAKEQPAKQPAEQAAPVGVAPMVGAPGGAPAAGPSRPAYPPFAELLKDAKTIEGLIRLHRK